MLKCSNYTQIKGFNSRFNEHLLKKLCEEKKKIKKEWLNRGIRSRILAHNRRIAMTLFNGV